MGRNEESVENQEPGAKLYGLDPNGNWIELSVDSNGHIDVSFSGDSIQLIDPDNEIAEFESLGTSLGGSEVAIITKLSEALTSVNNEQIRVDLENANTPIEIEGDDDDANTLQVNVEAVNQAITDPDGLVTYGDRALNTQGDDEYVVRVAGSDGTQVVEEALNSAVNNTDQALLTYIGRALQSVDNDSIRVTKATRDEVTDFNRDVDINGNTQSFQFDVTAGMESVTISVDDADGSFHVEIEFQDGSGNNITVRDDNNLSSYSGDSTTDVFVDTELASPQCNIKIVDDSGASNVLDYTLRAD